MHFRQDNIPDGNTQTIADLSCTIYWTTLRCIHHLCRPSRIHRYGCFEVGSYFELRFMYPTFQMGTKNSWIKGMAPLYRAYDCTTTILPVHSQMPSWSYFSSRGATISLHWTWWSSQNENQQGVHGNHSYAPASLTIQFHVSMVTNPMTELFSQICKRHTKEAYHY